MPSRPCGALCQYSPSSRVSLALISHSRELRRLKTYLFSVDSAVISLDHEVLLPCDVYAVHLHLFRVRVIFECADDFGHFLRGYLEGGGGGPDAGAFRVEDGRFVDVAGAD